MSDNWKCSTCRKVVVPKKGKLSCCGITETVQDAETARKLLRRNISKTVDNMFPEAITHYGDHPDDDFHEGIPNT